MLFYQFNYLLLVRFLKLRVLFMVVADNVFVQTVTVSGATPVLDIPDDDDDEIIIDENKVVQESITLGEEYTPGTFNTYRFQKIYNYDNYVYGQNEDNVTCTVTDFIGNTSTASVIIVINKVDDAPPTIVNITPDKPVISLSSNNTTELVTFTGIVVDNVSLSSVSLPGASLNNVNGSIYTFTKNYLLDDFNFGNNVNQLYLPQLILLIMFLLEMLLFLWQKRILVLLFPI